MSNELAKRLRAARKAIHPEMTQKDVAQKFGRHASAITLWENGTNSPSPMQLLELSKMYNVSLEWLLGEDVPQVSRHAPSAKGVMHSVPVVPMIALLRWKWDVVAELLQTGVAYPENTAAAVVVPNDALNTTCPFGSYAVISKAHTPDHGQVVLVAMNRVAEPVLRRFVREGGDELLIADDVRYPTYRLSDGAQIIGRVTEVTIRKMLH